MPVTCGLGGVVHDYVPFYFCKRSSMLLNVIYSKNVDQHELIHFALPISVLDEPNVVFTDASANTDIPPNFYIDPSDLIHLSWTAIDSLKYSLPTAEKQARMAEVLVPTTCNVAAFDHIIAWNAHMTAKVQSIYRAQGMTPPRILMDNKFHFTKWPEDETKSLVAGPKAISFNYAQTIGHITTTGQNPQARFRNLDGLLAALRADFGCLPETQELVGLESDNAVHFEDVGQHTQTVVRNLLASDEYAAMNSADQRLVEIAAYLHDIGKGPKSRWADNDGKQKNDPDHPIGSVIMLRRILTEEITTIKPRSIRVLAKLVCYHDLVGDIVGKGRHEQQFVDIAGTERELDMLIALGKADMSALNFDGSYKIPALRARVLARLNAATPEDED